MSVYNNLLGYEDISDYNPINGEYLIHYGVKGMKWKNHIYAKKDLYDEAKEDYDHDMKNLPDYTKKAKKVFDEALAAMESQDMFGRGDDEDAIDYMRKCLTWIEMYDRTFLTAPVRDKYQSATKKYRDTIKKRIDTMQSRHDARTGREEDLINRGYKSGKEQGRDEGYQRAKEQYSETYKIKKAAGKVKKKAKKTAKKVGKNLSNSANDVKKYVTKKKKKIEKFFD